MNAGGDAILTEATLTGTVQYLYGHDCLGQYANLQTCDSQTCGWLYYLNDGSGLVRQGTDAGGELVSTWLFDPDGTLLEGPEGPVSHLVCGGVYDWSTGLIYKNNNYFDPTLGIWLALTPLVVVQSWKRRKRRKGLWAVMLMLFLMGMSVILTGCDDETPTPEDICTEVPTPTPAPTPACGCDCLPPTGAEPVYEPDKWNDEGAYQNTNNCYSYAADDYRIHLYDGLPRPGVAGGQYATYSPTCTLLMYNAELDGFEACNKPVAGSPIESDCTGYDCDKPCPGGQYKVMLFRDPAGEPLAEYHFYRQDQGGCWSHKRGHTAVTNLDSEGNLIGDPRTAKKNYPEATYDDPCGCLCVKRGTETEAPNPLPPR